MENKIFNNYEYELIKNSIENNINYINMSNYINKIQIIKDLEELNKKVRMLQRQN